MRNKSMRQRVAYGLLGLFLAGGALAAPLGNLAPDDGKTAITMAAELDGWVTEGGKTYYYVNGQKQYLTHRLKGKLYYFDRDTGVQQTGWIDYGTHTYYFLSSTKPEGRYAVFGGSRIIDNYVYFFEDNGFLRKNQWIKATGLTTYVGEDGKRAAGWTKIDGSWYYFDKQTGDMYTGSHKIDGTSYTFQSDGKLVGNPPASVEQPEQPEQPVIKTGWQEEGGKKYYYDETGKKVTEWLRIGKGWYYFNADGVMQTGWQQIGKKWYYFDAAGAMKTGWQQIDKKWYYFDASGAMKKGWIEISKVWYYLNGSGAMVTGWKTIGGTTYFFKANGAMAANEWVKGYKLDSNGAWTYKYQATWHQLKGKWWYGDSNGWYAKSETLKIDGKKYTFDARGYMK